jgi:hypothetical protein
VKQEFVDLVKTIARFDRKKGLLLPRQAFSDNSQMVILHSEQDFTNPVSVRSVLVVIDQNGATAAEDVTELLPWLKQMLFSTRKGPSVQTGTILQGVPDQRKVRLGHDPGSSRAGDCE